MEPILLPTPNAARGEVALVVAGQSLLLKFNLHALYAWTQLTGHAPSQFGEQLDVNYIATLSELIACAVQQAGVPGFSQDDAIELIQGLSEQEGDQLAEAIMQAVTPDPLVAALRKRIAAKQAQQLEGTVNGAATSNSPSAS